MSNKLQAKDLINLGLFTVLYFVIGCCVAIPVGFVPIFLPILGALWSLITGIPFMLFLTRVKKFGMVTIMGILSGLLMGLTGMGFWGVPMGVIFGLLGDLILKSGGYKSAKKSLIGYAVFSLWMVGTYIPMYFMVEDSWASFAASFGEEYADRVMAVMPMWSIILVIAGIFIFAILGGLLGKALLKKHFAAILTAIISGVFTSAASIFAMSLVFRLDHGTYASLLPKSITTAIGMGISEEVGGMVTVTVVCIIATGIFGNIIGETVFRILGIQDPMAKGLALGTSAHAIGTAKALELGEVEGAMSSLSIAVAGILTVIAVPLAVGLI